MGRAQNQMFHDPFHHALGGKRGLGAAVRRQQDEKVLARLEAQVPALTIGVLDGGQTELLDSLPAYQAFLRDNPQYSDRPAFQELAYVAGILLSKEVVHEWWETSQWMLRKIFPGAITRSPWLVKQRLGTEKALVHVRDLGFESAHLTTVCGMSFRVGEMEVMPRGAWKSPSRHKAKRCPACIKNLEGRTIPAVKEKGWAEHKFDLWRGDSTQMLATETREMILKDDLDKMQQTIEHKMSDEVVRYFVALAEEDPMPVAFSLASEGTKARMRRIEDRLLTEKLETIDWQTIFEEAVPLEPHLPRNHDTTGLAALTSNITQAVDDLFSSPIAK